MEKYLVKADYSCPSVVTGGKWFVKETEKQPQLGVVCNGGSYLPEHGCRKYYESQACEDDETCFWQTILEVRQFSTEEAKRLKAEESVLEAKCQNAA